MNARVLALLLFASAFACEPDDVVIWSMPSTGGGGGSSSGTGGGGTGGGGGTSPAPGTSGAGSGGLSGSGGTSGADGGSAGSAGGADGDCSSNDDCPVAWVCERSDCFAPFGVCEPRPVFCPPEPLPVCGCDQVTYWNDCVRRQSGMSAAVPGECRSGALRCDVGADCGVPNASCARFVPWGEPCDPMAPGTCWVTPAVCEPSADPLRWHECGVSGPGPAPECVDTCQAIVSECPHVPAHWDEMCQ